MNTSEQKNTGLNSKSGPKVAQSSGPVAQFAKSDSRYWKPRLQERAGCAGYYVRIQHGGRREWFATNSANLTTGADTARRIFLDVVSLGWVGALAKHKPKPVVADQIATVGEVITAAGKIAAVRPATLATYGMALRRLAAEIAGIASKDATAKFGYRRAEFAAHRAKVDAVTVDLITAGAVAEWRARKVAARKTPVEQKSASISCDTVIRSAAALFGEKLRPILTKELRLPDPLPLAGVSYGRSTRRFTSAVNPSWLFAQAQKDLAKKEPEMFKAFTLCLLAGLRRAEADCLSWQQLDLAAGRLSIRATPYFHPKSEESGRDIDLPLAAVEVLRKFKKNADPVFVLKGGKAKPSARYKYYRADAAPWRTWERLRVWLTGKGIIERKAVHALRKHAGSLIHGTYGLETARAFLGHRDISTTSASYLEKRASVTVQLAPLNDEVAAERKEAASE